MTTEDSIKNATNSIELVSKIMKAAGENPEVKQAAQNLGQTALTITKTINNALLPLAAVNFGFDKAKVYFAGKFQKDISEKTSKIPFDQVVEPKASIAGPALQGLAFTHEEANLKDMYLSLLATSMDGRVADQAHPAFVEIIKQLNSVEADLIGPILQALGPIPIGEVRLSKNGVTSWSALITHLLNLQDSETGVLIEIPKLPAMVDNWIRLGLVNVDHTKFIKDGDSYAWLNLRPEVIKLKEKHENEEQKITFAFGVIQRTALGIEFSKAVGLS